MPHQNADQLIECLKDWGLVVHETPGCRTAGSSDFHPQGHLLHHDVIADQPGDADKMPSILRDGRPDLAGPLCNFWLEVDADVHICALGKANHGGEGLWHGLNENAELWGTEMNNCGTPACPWPDKQLEGAVLLSAALGEFSGYDASVMTAGHKEYALPPGRKPDPHSIDMPRFRGRIKAARKGGSIIMNEHDQKYFDTWRERSAKREKAALKGIRRLNAGQKLTNQELQDIEDLLTADN